MDNKPFSAVTTRHVLQSHLCPAPRHRAGSAPHPCQLQLKQTQSSLSAVPGLTATCTQSTAAALPSPRVLCSSCSFGKILLKAHRMAGTTGLSSECSHEDATGKGVPSLNSKCSQQPLKAGTSSVCQCRE